MFQSKPWVHDDRARQSYPGNESPPLGNFEPILEGAAMSPFPIVQSCGLPVRPWMCLRQRKGSHIARRGERHTGDNWHQPMVKCTQYRSLQAYALRRLWFYYWSLVKVALLWWGRWLLHYSDGRALVIAPITEVHHETCQLLENIPEDHDVVWCHREYNWLFRSPKLSTESFIY